MTFSISARDSNIKPDSEAGGLIPGTIWKISCYNLFITYFTLTFILQKNIFEPTNCENKSLRALPLFNLQIFLFQVWFQKDMSICTMTSESVCKIYP